jgi:hypothetical protein
MLARYTFYDGKSFRYSFDAENLNSAIVLFAEFYEREFPGKLFNQTIMIKKQDGEFKCYHLVFARGKVFEYKLQTKKEKKAEVIESEVEVEFPVELEDYTWLYNDKELKFITKHNDMYIFQYTDLLMVHIFKYRLQALLDNEMFDIAEVDSNE